jgi:hypothetical protein
MSNQDKVLLSLDMSTTCTGWSVFDIKTKKLLTYGILKPSSKGISSMEYPLQQLTKMIDLSIKMRSLIENYKPHHIVIEEIAGSRQRLGQKVLDGLHWIMLHYNQEYIPIISYYDVTGPNGWRTDLGLKLTDSDKLANKEAKKINPKLGRGVTKMPTYGPKELAARHANRKFSLQLDTQANQYDADIADSVSMGDAWLTFKCPKDLT